MGLSLQYQITKKLKIMKIQAKDVKIGDIVKWGLITIKVKEIQDFTQKNGIKGKTFFGPAFRSCGRGIEPIVFKDYDISPKNDTWLALKVK
jgi:hypothetical protein